MQTGIRVGVTLAAIAVVSSPVLAAESSAPKEVRKPSLMSLLGGNDVVEAAKDLRVAAETFERVIPSLERITSNLAEAFVVTSTSGAKMSEGFDPFGYKAAFQTIQQQQATVRSLHEAEVGRLERECRELKREVRELKCQLKTREHEESQPAPGGHGKHKEDRTSKQG